MFMCDPRPWKLPVPFVGPAIRSFAALIFLANTNALYDKLEFFGPSISCYLYSANIFMMVTIFGTLCAFASQRLRNNTFNYAITTLTMIVSGLWAIVLVFNLGIVISGFVICNAPGFQKEREVPYCHYFGNRKLVEIHGWDKRTLPTYFWVNFTLVIVMSCWQMMNWLVWHKYIKSAIRGRYAIAS